MANYIAGIAGTGTAGYFTDQDGRPKLLRLEQCWALPWNAGRWNGGNWQADIDGYFEFRATQGLTAWFGVPWADDHVDGSCLTGGRTWDGIYPFTVNGTPGPITAAGQTVALNDAFWTRIDYLFASALANGIACFPVLGMQYDYSSPNNAFYNASTTQAGQIGTAIATRYPQGSYPHVFWFFGDDSDGGQDPWHSAMLTAIRNTGDTRPVSCEQMPETNCHIQFDTGAVYVTGGFGMTSADYNWAYSYDPVYNAIEKSYIESGTTPKPVVWGDGVWYGDSSGSTPDYTTRRFAWWALASGARGINTTSGPTPSGDVWQWQSNAMAYVANDPIGPWVTSVAKVVCDFFTSLTGWHRLIPDTGNALVTAGRGTKTTNDAPGFNAAKYGDTDAYVAASRVADGSLAVIYMPKGTTITIDESKMKAGYGVKWVDPVTCAIGTGTTGTTYNSTARGNNSAGNPDWALVLASPPYATWTVP